MWDIRTIEGYRAVRPFNASPSLSLLTFASHGDLPVKTTFCKRKVIIGTKTTLELPSANFEEWRFLTTRPGARDCMGISPLWRGISDYHPSDRKCGVSSMQLETYVLLCKSSFIGICISPGDLPIGRRFAYNIDPVEYSRCVLLMKSNYYHEDYAVASFGRFRGVWYFLTAQSKGSGLHGEIISPPWMDISNYYSSNHSCSASSNATGGLHTFAADMNPAGSSIIYF